jgi:thiamine kinase
MAEVFAYGEGRVLKLDRPEWDGVSAFESDVITRVAGAGLPVARSHGVVTIDGRCGVVLDRVEGRSLLEELQESSVPQAERLAERFSALQACINETVVDGLPDLVGRLTAEIAGGGLPTRLVAELVDLLAQLDDGRRGVCHFDFTPANVMVAAEGWVVIDWLGAAGGPPLADVARTLLLGGHRTDTPLYQFQRAVCRHSLARHGVDEATCDAWVRVAAAARLAEGFEGGYAGWLTRIAHGAEPLPGHREPP